MSETWTRRRVLAGTGALVVGTTGSIAVLSDNATATATVDGEFTIPDGETVLAGSELQDVRLRVDAEWGYDSNAPIHAIELELHAGPSPDDVGMLARHEDDDIGTDALTGETTLTGSLTDNTPFDVTHFEPSSGEVTTGVVASLRFYALRNGEVVADAEKTASFDVGVSKEDLQVTLTHSANGTVEFDQRPVTETPSQ